ncbi:MAG TPA: response regulator [Candidatus Kapabacteria bacterium]
MKELFETGIFVAPVRSIDFPTESGADDLFMPTTDTFASSLPTTTDAWAGIEYPTVTKILVVDDHPENLLALEATLSHSRSIVNDEQNALEFVRATTGREALRKVLEDTFAVILLDVQMPGMDGFETAELIRKRTQSQHTPIIFLTAVNTTDLNIFQGYSLGAVDYLAKPFNPTILRAKVGVFVELYRRELKIRSMADDLREQARLLRISNEELGRTNKLTGALNLELERKSIELSKERDFIDKILDTAGSYIVIFSPDGSLVRFNRAGEELTGYTVKELRGRKAWELLVVEDDAPNVQAAFERIAAGESSVHVEMSLTTRTRGVRRLLLTFTGIHDEKGAATSIIAAGIDITERHLMEAKSRELNEELERRVRERTQELERANTGLENEITVRRNAEVALSQAKEAAELANSAKDKFLAVLSHELRTPLTPVLAIVQMMKEDPGVTPDQMELIETIGRNIQLEARLIDDLLDLTRIANGKLELHSTLIDVHETIDETLQICGDDIAAKDLKLTLDLKAKQTAVRADEARLQQVLWNLIKNAVKFTSAGGSIALRTKNTRHGTIEIQVIDTGIGIPAEHLTSIFNAFEQGDRAITRRFGGIGLGLAISKALIEQHKGSIRAESDGQNTGATIVVELPLAAQIEPSDSFQKPPLPQPNITPAARLLLVEDNDDTSRALKVLFERKGFNVTVAKTVTAAIDAARNSSFDIVISDIGLPDGDGYDVMRAINSIRPTHGIAISGYGMDGDRKRSLEAGFDTHLVKPLNFDELTAAVKKLVLVN